MNIAAFLSEGLTQMVLLTALLYVDVRVNCDGCTTEALRELHSMKSVKYARHQSLAVSVHCIRRQRLLDG
jgi:hypothetical protein